MKMNPPFARSDKFGDCQGDRALAGPAGANDHHHFLRIDIEADPAQDLDLSDQVRDLVDIVPERQSHVQLCLPPAG